MRSRGFQLLLILTLALTVSACSADSKVTTERRSPSKSGTVAPQEAIASVIAPKAVDTPVDTPRVTVVPTQSASPIETATSAAPLATASVLGTTVAPSSPPRPPINVIFSTARPEDILQEILFAATGGGGGSDVYAGEAAPDMKLCPTKVRRSSLHDKLSFAELGVASHDELPVSIGGYRVCGLTKPQMVAFSLHDFHGGTVAQKMVESKIVVDPCGSILSYCASSDEIVTLDLLPSTMIGSYVLVAQAAEGTLSHSLNIVSQSTPRVYYSDTLQGYVFAGFDANERLRLLLYQMSEQTDNSEYPRPQFLSQASIQLDQLGEGLVSRVRETSKQVLASGFFDCDLGCFG